MTRKLTTKEFITKAKKVHGDRYDYSLVVYKHAHAKVKIICPDHGQFLQTPGKHGNQGRGCPDCGNIKQGKSQSLGKEAFISKAKKIHSDKYDYSLVDYVNAHTDVEIICLIENHGTFTQPPNDHLYQRSGCPKCGGRLITNTVEFIQASIIAHSEKYDYSKSIFTNAKAKVIIGCPFHGEFKQAAYHHSHGIGCKKCGDEIRTLGDTINALEKLGRDYDGSLYVLELSNNKERFYKIGISRDLKRRYTGMLALPYENEVLLEVPIGMVKAYKTEQAVLSALSKYSYKPEKYFTGQTECLSVNPIEHDPQLAEIAGQYSSLESN